MSLWFPPEPPAIVMPDKDIIRPEQLALMPIAALKVRKAAAAAVAKRYWRLRFPNGSPHASYLAIYQIAMADTVGGADLTSTPGAFASSYDLSSPGFPPSEAFDNGSSSNAWFCASGSDVGSYIGCDLGGDHDIQEIIVQGHGTTAAYGPTDIEVDYSPDGVTWTHDTRWPSMAGLLWDVGSVAATGEIKKIRRSGLGAIELLNIGNSWNINTNNGAWTGFTIRQPLDTIRLPGQGGTKVRFAFMSSTAEGLNLNKCYLGKLSGTYGFAAAPVQVTFNGGSTSVNIPANTVQWSDEVTISWASTDGLCVSAFIAAGQAAADGFRAGGNGPGTYYKSGDDAINTAPSGYSTVAVLSFFLAGVETW